MAEHIQILAAFDQLESALFVLDMEDRIVAHNRAALNASGVENDSLEGKFFQSITRSMVSEGPSSENNEQVFCTFGSKQKPGQTLLFRRKQIDIDQQAFILLQQVQWSQAPEKQADVNYQEFFDAIPDLVIVLDQENKISTYHLAEGIDRQVLNLRTSKTLQEVLSEEVYKVFEEALRKARKDGQAKGFTFGLQSGNESIHYNLFIQKGSAGDSNSFICIAHEINKIQSHIEPEENEAHYRSLIEQSSDGIVLINEKGHIILWNKGMEAITGIPSDHSMQQPLWEVMFEMASPAQKNLPGTKDQLMQRTLGLLAGQQQQWIGQAIENDIVHASGNTRLITTVYFPVEYNGKTLLGVMYRDITAQKMAELSLRENEEYIRTLYYDSPVPVLVIDTKSHEIFDLNNAAVLAFGYDDRMQMIAMSVFDLLPQGSNNLKKLQHFLHEVSGGETSAFDCSFLKKQKNQWDAKVHAFTLSVNERDLAQLMLIDTTTQNRAMKALFESESRYRAVAENASAGIYITNPEGGLEYVNETLAGMLGFTKEELLGQQLSLILQLTDAKEQHALLQGNQMQLEARLICKNGIEKSCSVSTSSFFAADDVFAGSLGVLIDITDQKTAEKQLLETSRKMQAILDAMPDMIFIMDSKGVYLDTFVNPLLYQNTAYQPQKGQSVSELFSEHDARRIVKAIQTSLAKKQTTILNFDYGIGVKTLHLEARISPMGLDQVVSVVRDTTTLVTLETELVYNNNLLRMLTQLATRFINLPVGHIENEINNALAELGVFAGVDRVYIFDYEWESDYMSNTFEWCAEGISAEIENLQMIPNSFLPDWVSSHKRGEMTYVPSVSNLDKDNNLRVILEPQGIKSLITIPLMDGNHCMGYVGFDAVTSERVFTDSELSLLRIFAELLTNLKIRQNTDALLTQSRKTLEKQNEQLLNLNERLRQQNEEIMLKNKELDVEREKALASDRLKTAFLNNVSHEVRTPLNGITGFAQFLSEENISSEDREEFTTALNASVIRLTDTINDIMDVSLLMSGNMTVHPEKIHAKSLADEVFRKHKFEARTKGLQFDYKITDDDMEFVSDYGMVKKIIDELVGNAIKYTKEGFVEFLISRKANRIKIRVEDSGIGISETAMPKVFEPFVQEDVSSTRTYEGSGLGLTIVKGLADLINGTVEVESHSGKGTTFMVTIVDQNIESSGSEPVKQENTTNEQEHKCILVAEDEALNVLYVKRMFKNSPYQLLFAQNGKEAVEMVESHPEIGIVLMDIKMPVMDGLEATRRIRKLRAELPVVAVTAFATNDDRHACMEAGCNEYLSKPFVALELIHMIKKYV